MKKYDFAHEYIWKTMVENNDSVRAKIPNKSDVKINRSLNYRLCRYMDRTIAMFGEVTNREIANYIEHWIAAQADKVSPPEPYEIGPRVL
jgi:hypothetical protein